MSSSSQQQQAEYPSYTGRCLCGAVEFKISGKPLFNCIYHCSICRFNHSAHFKHAIAMDTKDITWVKGKDNLAGYTTPASKGGLGLKRCFCKDCGTAIWSDWTESEAYKHLSHYKGVSGALFATGDVVAEGKVTSSVLPEALLPQFHVFYADRVRDVDDKLPHFKDLPKDFGGSGELI
jgi:hypothetical protein